MGNWINNNRKMLSVYYVPGTILSILFVLFFFSCNKFVRSDDNYPFFINEETEAQISHMPRVIRLVNGISGIYTQSVVS